MFSLNVLLFVRRPPGLPTGVGGGRASLNVKPSFSKRLATALAGTLGGLHSWTTTNKWAAGVAGLGDRIGDRIGDRTGDRTGDRNGNEVGPNWDRTGDRTGDRNGNKLGPNWDRNGTEMRQTWDRNGTEMGPKWDRNFLWDRKGTEMGPKWDRIAPKPKKA